MSDLRWISRGGKMILQQNVNAGLIMNGPHGPIHLESWEDVPVAEEPKEPEYVIANACDCAGQSSKVNTRLIDERLADKLVEALEDSRERIQGFVLSTIQIDRALALYRKHLVKK